MPPKKKKKGRKSRSSTPGGQDTVGATLKARLEEVTAEYEAGVARREALGKARLERMEVLAALEAEAELRRRGQDDAGERALERHEEAVSDLEGRIDELSAERANLEVELGALDLAVCCMIYATTAAEAGARRRRRRHEQATILRSAGRANGWGLKRKSRERRW